MRVLAVLVGLLLVAGLVYVGTEMRYRNCVEAAVASTPPPRPPPTWEQQYGSASPPGYGDGGGSGYEGGGPGYEGGGNWTGYAPLADHSRRRAVARCKRLPL